MSFFSNIDQMSIIFLQSAKRALTSQKG